MTPSHPTPPPSPEKPIAPSPQNNGKVSHPRRFPRQLLYVLGGLGGVGLLIYAFQPQPIAVDVAPVERGSLAVTINAEGKTRVRDRFVIAAPVDGELQRIQLNAGDTVEGGMTVAQIDPLPLTSQVQAAMARLRSLEAERVGVETLRPKPAAIAQAEAQIAAALATEQRVRAQVAQAEATLAQATRDLDRAAELRAEGAISQQNLESAQLARTTHQRELDTVRQEMATAQAQVQAARAARNTLLAEQRDPDYLLDVYQSQIEGVRAELANLAEDARRTTITTPGAGQVLRVLQESRRFVAAGTPLLEVGNAGSLELVIDILSTDAVRVTPGNPIRIEHWGGDAPLLATVRYVEPSAFTKVSALGVEEQRVNVIADFQPGTVPLGDGYRVDAHIVVWEAEDVLKVPASALFRCDLDWCAFVVRNGRAQRQTVEVQQRSDLAAAIAGGLTPGDTVILYPNENIESNTRVATR